MEIETEIIVVIIASFASLILGIINVIFNAKISARQNQIELKKTRIELLENRRQKIEAVKYEISNRVIDVSDIKKFDFEIHFPRIIDFFQKNSNSIFSIGHLIDKGFINELKELNKQINEYIAKSKQQIKLDENEVLNNLKDITRIGNKIIDALDESLMNLESEINILLK